MALSRWVLGIALAAGSAGAAQAAVDTSRVPQTTGDLVALCSASPGTPMHGAAHSFCHGFALGVVAVELEHQRMSGVRIFCLPDPAPTVEQGAADFAAWANASPARLAEPAADGVLRYLADTYRCPEPAPAEASKGRRR